MTQPTKLFSTLALLSLITISIISILYLYLNTHDKLDLLCLQGHQPDSIGDGVGYYVQIGKHVDDKWLRMNTALSKAYKVCEEATSNHTCDVVLPVKSGWNNLCQKTRMMFNHLCNIKQYQKYKYIVKVDDDTLVDPEVNVEIESLQGDVYFGSSQSRSHRFFAGQFYGFNTEVVDKMCACDRPTCASGEGEDVWVGRVLRVCKIQKREVFITPGLVYHRMYDTERMKISFATLRD